MTRIYNRSEIVSYYDLSTEQQKYITEMYFDNIDDAEQDSYVIMDEEYLNENKTESAPLPLSMFMRTNYGTENSTKKQVWDGIYSTTAFSAYFIKLSKCGTMAVVADRYF